MRGPNNRIACQSYPNDATEAPLPWKLLSCPASLGRRQFESIRPSTCRKATINGLGKIGSQVRLKRELDSLCFRKAVEPNRNRRTGTATTPPRRTEPQWNPGNRTGKRFLSLSLSLCLSLCLSLSRSLSPSLALYRAVCLSVSVSVSRSTRTLSLSLSLSRAWGRVNVPGPIWPTHYCLLGAGSEERVQVIMTADA